MKFLHLSDLHLGKRVNGFSMLEDQAAVLQQILDITRHAQPDGVLLAGDVYDKSVPSVEAVKLFDWFLRELAGMTEHIFIISGNHDSPERLAFASSLLENAGVHISQSYEGHVAPISLQDKFGTVDVYLLPFVKPVQVRPYFPEAGSYTDAMRCAISQMNRNPNHRSVLVTHQFVTGSICCDSEELSVGGTDQVDAAVFDGFDYVALGHLHGAQAVGGDHLRYSGSPLKYSFSEEHHQKTVTVVEFGAQGSRTVHTVPLKPLRDLQTIRGTYLEVTALEFYRQFNRENYFRIILTDQQDVPQALGRLRVIYPNLMRLEYDNARTRNSGMSELPDPAEEQSPQELFRLFYAQQNGCSMTPEQEMYLDALIRQLWEVTP